MGRALESRSAGGFVVNNLQEVLLVQEFGEFWGLPRGHIEDNEDALATAKREIEEETGLTDVTKIADLGSYTRSTFNSDGNPNYKEIKHITFFAFVTRSTETSPQDKAITDIGWFSFNEAKKKLINKEDLDFFLGAIDKVTSVLNNKT